MIKKIRAPVRIDFGGGTTDIKEFSSKYGGAVLNAAINHYVFGKLSASNSGTKLEYHADIPTSSGLGTSSAMNVVWLALITHIKDKKKIAESVFKIEQASKESSVNGKQDQYASAFGGINYLEFIGDEVKISQVKLKKELIKKLESKLLLVYSGESHYSGNSNKAMIDNLLKGRVTDNLLRIKAIAGEMKEALLNEDLNSFSDLMNQETEERRKLSKTTLSPQLKSIIDKGMKNGASGAKICGSGGGGSILFFGDKARLKRYFGKKAIEFKFDFSGLIWGE